MNLSKENQKIARKIKLLTEIRPRKEWKDSFRDILMSEIKAESQMAHSKVNAVDYLSIFSQSIKYQVFQPAVGILLVIGVFLGSSLLVNAAFYSLPGDNLYDLKIALEKTQVSLILDDGKKTELRMEFIKNRVEEFEKIANLRPQDLQQETVNQITKKFKNDLESINQHIVQLDQDKKAVFSLAKAIDTKTAELAKTLAANKDKLPENVKKQVEEAVNDAVATANTASDAAFQIALNSYQAGAEETEIIELVGEKIENLEQKLSEIEDGELLIEAQAVIEEAGIMLENGDLEAAAENITQTQELVNQIENQSKIVENEVNLAESSEDVEDTDSMDLNSQTSQVLEQATSTQEGVERDTFLETTDHIIE